METADIITLVFSGVVALSTVVYAVLTWKLVDETRLLRRAETTPQVGVYLRPSRLWINIFELVIENHGRGPACEVRWDFGVLNIDDLEKAGVHLGWLRNLDGLTYMAPGHRIESFFGSGVDLLKMESKSVVTLRVDYRDLQGERYQSTYTLDPSKYKNLSRVGRDPALEMAEEMKDFVRVSRAPSRVGA